MTKIDNFKSFVRRNPNLITYVREKNTSWQEFYELYDLYGEDPTIWNKYLNKEEKRVEAVSLFLGNWWPRKDENGEARSCDFGHKI